MARTFRRNRQMHALSELNVTNLLDLAFVLLIIFMIATPLLNEEQMKQLKEQTVPVNLPVDTARPQQPPDKDTKFIVVTVKVDGTYMIDADGNKPLSARDLPGRLKALAVSAPGKDQPVIRVRGDANVPFQKIITLMGELEKAGLGRVSFDTQTAS
jgi:biopolymer transport protein TolR